LVSHNPTVRWELHQHLFDDGFRIISTESAARSRLLLNQGQIDLLIVDGTAWDSPQTAWEACQEMRTATDKPIIALVSQVQHVQRALQLGLDDVLTQPIYWRELAARIRAILRRTSTAGPKSSPQVYLDHDLLIDFESREVWVRGQRVAFTPQEFVLLASLARHANQVLSPLQIAWSAWGDPAGEASLPLLKQYIWRLRRKVEITPSKPKIVLTHRGEGYEFRRSVGPASAESAPPPDSPSSL